MVTKNKDEISESPRVLVTSGPTRAWLDQVRYIANTSTGALGASIVEALVDRGIPVTHIIGEGGERPTCEDSVLYEPVEVTTLDDLVAAVKTIAGTRDIRAVVHSMAVLDYVPGDVATGKKSSDSPVWDMQLVRAPKVIDLIHERMPEAVLVGFKLEAGIDEAELVARAERLRAKNDLALVVANDIERIHGDCHEAIFVGTDSAILGRAATKVDIARYIAAFVVSSMNDLNSERSE